MARFRKKSRGRPKRDAARDRRITMEIVVDGHDEREQTMG